MDGRKILKGSRPRPRFHGCYVGSKEILLCGLQLSDSEVDDRPGTPFDDTGVPEECRTEAAFEREVCCGAAGEIGG